jgi:hypothetical protein
MSDLEKAADTLRRRAVWLTGFAAALDSAAEIRIVADELNEIAGVIEAEIAKVRVS